jgi:NAD-dependent SIR2 family protein deacetylase
MQETSEKKKMKKIASIIKNSPIVIAALGAGMSKESKIPTYEDLGASYVEMSNAKMLQEHPEAFFNAWLQLFNTFENADPHEGYDVLNQICHDKTSLVYTTNVDGLSKRSGLKNVYHVHGKHTRLQCSVNCQRKTWEVDPHEFIDQKCFPTCPDCGLPSRPNVFMFEDYKYVEDADEELAFSNWMETIEKQLANNERCVILEVGSGTRVPIIRIWTQTLIQKYPNVFLIRVNPKNSKWTFKSAPPNSCSTRFISVQMSGLEFFKELKFLYQQ